MIPKPQDEEKMEEICACSGARCRLTPSTAINPSDNKLKCHVRFTNDLVKFNKMFFPEIEFPNIPIPPKLMDCADWHDILDNNRKENIKRLKKQRDPLHLIPILEKLSFCKNDCQFCASSSTTEFLGCNIITKTCVGPEQMKILNDLPKNSCVTHDFNEQLKLAGAYFSPESDTFGRKNQMKRPETETCTCSSDGCNQKTTKDGNQCPNIQMMIPSTVSGNNDPYINLANVAMILTSILGIIMIR